MTKKIAIIGAGLGGLTAALQLHRLGFEPIVFEAAREIRPLGVGIVSQTYATKEITALGLLDELNANSVDATESLYYNQYGQEIYGERCGTHMGYEHAMRYIHRGTAQMMLYKAVIERLGRDAVVSGMRCTGFTQDADSATALLKDDAGNVTEYRCDAIIAADGIKSAVRRQLYPASHEPHYSGITLWRGVTKMKPFKGGGTILHIGAPSQGSLIVYPIADNIDAEGNTLVNWVVEQNGRPAGVEDWNAKADVKEIAHMFDDCELDFIDAGKLLRDASEVFVFPLIDHDPLQKWSFGRVTLIGDAAHAMYPRGGNGACQAFVDARVVAECLSIHESVEEAFVQYETQRLPIANKIVMANRGDGPEVVRRIVEERTGGQRFDDIEKVLPFEEADSIFKQYHRLAGMKRPNDSAPSGFRSVFAE